MFNINSIFFAEIVKILRMPYYHDIMEFSGLTIPEACCELPGADTAFQNGLKLINWVWRSRRRFLSVKQFHVNPLLDLSLLECCYCNNGIAGIDGE